MSFLHLKSLAADGHFANENKRQWHNLFLPTLQRVLNMKLNIKYSTGQLKNLFLNVIVIRKF